MTLQTSSSGGAASARRRPRSTDARVEAMLTDAGLAGVHTESATYEIPFDGLRRVAALVVGDSHGRAVAADACLRASRDRAPRHGDPRGLAHAGRPHRARGRPPVTPSGRPDVTAASRSRVLVANHRHSTDMRQPEGDRGQRARWSRRRRRRATGIESGIRVMSPRLVTDETRPVYAASTALRNAPDSHTLAIPAVTPTVSMPTSTTGTYGTPTTASPTPCSTSTRKPEPRGVRRLPPDRGQAAHDRTRARARRRRCRASAGPRPSRSTRSARPSATTGLTKTLSAVRPITKMRAVGVRRR